jgi:regulator of CtrA degradation
MAEALPMSLDQAKKRMTARLVDSLYTEAMVLADEARSYFDQIGRGDREALPPIARVAFSCESLKVTTRLMHVIAWLLTRKAIAAGEIGDGEGAPESRRLGLAADSDRDALTDLPPQAREIVAASIDLYDRVFRIDQGLVEPEPDSPALQLLRRVERAL